VHASPLALRELLREILRDFSMVGAKHRLVLSVPEEEVRVAGDSARLVQLFTNLIANSIKYSPNGGSIRVSLEVVGEEARIAVRDEGIGIPDDQQKRLFQRYFRARNAGVQSYPGMGLGLYICREIADRHGGRIWVESVEGKGTTFFVALPLLPRAGEVPAAPVERVARATSSLAPNREQE
jgi:signal transduction histidine kinase